MKLGVHASIRGGVQNAPERARDFGAECLQIFTKNQRRWEPSGPITDEEAEAFREQIDEHGYELADTFAHGSYLINVASDDDEQFDKSVDALVTELERASKLDLLGVCFHPGSHKGAGEEFALDRVVDGIEAALERSPDDTLLLVEGMPGAGTQVGDDLEHLAHWMDALPADRVGLTLDTCHLFVAGYDLRPEAYEATMQDLASTIDLDRVESWHLNDARHPYESAKDGHAAIGDGELGLAAFEALLSDERWAGLPASLETSPDTYETDLKRLRDVRSVDA
jgi:deoxyribonuclease-4